MAPLDWASDRCWLIVNEEGFGETHHLVAVHRDEETVCNQAVAQGQCLEILE